MTANSLADEVARASRRPGAARTLLLDLDGTLAPIAASPEAAAVPKATLEALKILTGKGWTVAVVSGRPASQVRRLVPLRAVYVFGSHGLEGAWDGRASPEIGSELRRRLTALARKGRGLASQFPGARLERKPAGLALHDRNLPVGELWAWRRRLNGWLKEQNLDGLEIIRGKRVLEIRPRGLDKGRIVRSMAAERRGAGPDPSLVAIGDDRTDEDMFRELRGRGLTVRVGRPLRGSVAQQRLPSADAVRRFLESLAESS